MSENNYYVYVYLDSRKMQTYAYDQFKFDYEPIYIGKGRNNRHTEHLKIANGIKKSGSTNTHLQHKIKKLLLENVEPIIIKYKEGLTHIDALQLEELMIKTIGRINLKTGPLVNMTDGGERANYTLSPESRQKLSIAGKKRIPWNKGKIGIYTIETLNKIAQSLRGKKRQPLTEYQKEACSRTHKGKIVSDETRRKLSESHKGHVPWNKGKKTNQIPWNKKK